MAPCHFGLKEAFRLIDDRAAGGRKVPRSGGGSGPAIAAKGVGLGRCGLLGISKNSWKMLVTKRRSPYSLEESGNFWGGSVVRLACLGIPGAMAERSRYRQVHFLQRPVLGRILVVWFHHVRQTFAT